MNRRWMTGLILICISIPLLIGAFKKGIWRNTVFVIQHDDTTHLRLANDANTVQWDFDLSGSNLQLLNPLGSGAISVTPDIDFRRFNKVYVTTAFASGSSTAGIAECLAAAGINEACFLPPGTHLMTITGVDPLLTIPSGASLIGAGPEVSIIKQNATVSSSTLDFLKVGADALVENLQIDANDSLMSHTGSADILLLAGPNSTARNVWIRDAHAGGIFAGFGTVGNICDRCSIFGVETSGVGGAPIRAWFTHLYIDGDADGHSCDVGWAVGGTGNTLINSTIEDCVLGVGDPVAGNWAPVRASIINNRITDTGTGEMTRGIDYEEVSGTDSILIANNILTGNFVLTSIGIEVDTKGNAVVINNTMDGMWDTSFEYTNTGTVGGISRGNLAVAGTWNTAAFDYTTIAADQIWDALQDMDMGGKKITDLANATADADALNRTTADGRYPRSIAGGNATNFLVNPGVTAYFALAVGTGSTTEDDVRWYSPIAGTIEDLRFWTNSNASDGVTTITVRKNGVGTGITVNYAAAITGLKTDLTNTITVAAGDRLTLSIVNAGASGAFNPGTWSLKVAP